MALTEVTATGPVLDSATAARGLRDDPIAMDALDQLVFLHRQAHQTLQLSQFLARSPAACIALMVAGAAALVWASCCDGGTLKTDFAWSALVLLGIIALTRNFIRGFARSLRRAPLEEATADLRVLLLYSGAAWGLGAFLVMPALPQPSLVICFAVIPAVALTVILGDLKAVLAFVLPSSRMCVTATLLGQWPSEIAVSIAILAADIAIIGLSMLRLRSVSKPIGQ